MSARRSRLAALGALAVIALSGCATGATGATGSNERTNDPTAPSSLGPPSTTAPASTPTTPGSTAPAPPTISVHAQGVPSLPARAPASTPVTRASSTSSHPGNPLPLKYPTGSATQVVTVTATSSSSTDARLQKWTKSGSTWVKVGSSMHAYLGRSGTSTNKHEGDGNTPSGSFTMTEAFGYDANPGTRLSYFTTDNSDWWISQPGALYNTHQRCSSTCPGGLHPASPSEHLEDPHPNYRYAVVINYNTSPVLAGRGSAVFLHVETGNPTSGCVSITSSNLITLMRWLQPSAHPRILIGVG